MKHSSVNLGLSLIRAFESADGQSDVTDSVV